MVEQKTLNGRSAASEFTTASNLSRNKDRELPPSHRCEACGGPVEAYCSKCLRAKISSELIELLKDPLIRREIAAIAVEAEGHDLTDVGFGVPESDS